MSDKNPNENEGRIFPFIICDSESESSNQTSPQAPVSNGVQPPQQVSTKPGVVSPVQNVQPGFQPKYPPPFRATSEQTIGQTTDTTSSKVLFVDLFNNKTLLITDSRSMNTIYKQQLFIDPYNNLYPKINNYQNQNSKTRKSVVGNGVFRVTRLLNHANSENEIEILVNNSDLITIPVSDLQSQSSLVLTRFAEAGLVLKKECRKELCEYILTISSSAPQNYIWKGFNLDESGRIVHSDEDQILRDTTETSDIIRASGIPEYPRNDEKYYKWMMINLLQISSFITLFKCYQITLPLIVFWTDDVNKTYVELSSFFCPANNQTNKRMKVSDYYTAETDRFIPVIVDKNSMTGNVVQKANDFLQHHDMNAAVATSLPVIITTEPGLFRSESTAVIRWHSYLVSQPEIIYSFTQNRILKKNMSFSKGNTRMQFSSIYYILDYIEDIDVLQDENYLKYLSSIDTHSDDTEDIVRSFIRTLINTDLRKDRLRSDSFDENTLYTDEKYIAMSSTLFSRLARESGCQPDMLKKELHDRNMLSCNQKGYQKNTEIAGEYHNLYVINQNEVFGDFSVGLQTSDKYPDASFRLGECKSPYGSNPVYYTFRGLQRNANQHCLILGDSGYGKTTLMKSMIRKSADSNLECVVIDSKQDYSDLTGEQFLHIRIGGDNGYVPYSEISPEAVFAMAECLQTGLSTEQKKRFRSKLSYLTRNNHYENLDSYITDCMESEKLDRDFISILENLADSGICRKKPLDWNSMLNPGRALIIDVDYNELITPDTLAPIVDSILLSFCKYKHSRPAVQTACTVMIDEARNYTIGTGSGVSKVLAELRSKNVAGFIATQFMSSENGTKVSSIIGQCRTKIIFRTSDLDSLRRILPKSNKSNEIIKEIDSLGVGTALVCSENKDTIFSGENYIGKFIKVKIDDPKQMM